MNCKCSPKCWLLFFLFVILFLSSNIILSCPLFYLSRSKQISSFVPEFICTNVSGDNNISFKFIFKTTTYLVARTFQRVSNRTVKVALKVCLIYSEILAVRLILETYGLPLIPLFSLLHVNHKVFLLKL